MGLAAKILHQPPKFLVRIDGDPVSQALAVGLRQQCRVYRPGAYRLAVFVFKLSQPPAAVSKDPQGLRLLCLFGRNGALPGGSLFGGRR